MLYAVGLAETGRGDSLRPYALNIEGRAVYDIDKVEALRRVEAARKAGIKLIDIGCMQINHHFHARNFASVADMLDPARNVDYAAASSTSSRPVRAAGQNGGALPRRSQQDPGAEEIRVPRHREHGRHRLRPMDAGGDPFCTPGPLAHLRSRQ